MRFLYFLAHKRAMDFFAAIGQAHPSHNELCQQRGAFFYQHRPASESRAPKLLHCGLGLLLHHAGKRLFRAPMHIAHALQEDLDANWGG